MDGGKGGGEGQFYFTAIHPKFGGGVGNFMYSHTPKIWCVCVYRRGGGGGVGGGRFNISFRVANDILLLH